MSGGTDIEANVGLEVDAGPVNEAIKQFLGQLTLVQSKIHEIEIKASEAAKTFGGATLKTMQEFNKVIGVLDRFQANISKLDPGAIRAKAAADTLKELEAEEAKLAKQRNAAYKDSGVIARQEGKKTSDEEKAHAQLRAQQEKEIASTATVAWNKHDMERRRQDVERSRAQRLADQQLTANYLAEQRAADAQRLKDARTFEQLRVKQAKDVAREGIANAPVGSLGNIRDESAQSLANLRAQRGLGSADEQRVLEQNILLEREFLSLVTKRIAAEEKASVSAVAKRIDASMESRAAKLDETSLLSAGNLGDARVRQSELADKIAATSQRIKITQGEERAELERIVTLDRERLGIADTMVRTLERQAQKEAERGKKVPLQPQEEDPSKKGGGFSLKNLMHSGGMTGAFANMFAYGVAGGAMYAVTGAMKEAIAESLQFQDSLEKIEAISGATGTQLVALGKNIQDVAEHSKFARSEIADTAVELAKAGYKAGEVKDALGPIVQLAQGTGSDLKETTNVVTGAIGAFNLGAQDTARVANTMAAAVNNSRLTMQELATGIQSAGLVASESNQSFSEFTASLAAMADAGLRGQQLGMGYRQVLIGMTTVSKAMADELKKLHLTMDDINVKTLGVSGAIANLTKAGFTSSDAFKVFGARASAAFLALKDAEIVSLRLAQAQTTGRAATDASAQAMGSLSSQWQRFKNVASDVLTNALGPTEDKLAHFFKTISDDANDPVLTKLHDALGKAMEGGDSDQIAKADKALADYTAEKKAAVQTEEAHAKAVEATGAALGEAEQAVKKEEHTLNEVESAISRVSVKKQLLKNDTVALTTETLNLENQFAGLAAQLQGVALNYDNLTKAMLNYRRMQLQANINDQITVEGTAQKDMNAASGNVGDDMRKLAPFMKSFKPALQKAIHDAEQAKTYEQRQQALIQIGDAVRNGEVTGNAAGLLTDFRGNVGRYQQSTDTRSNARNQQQIDQVKLTPEFTGFAEKLASVGNDPKKLKPMLAEAVQKMTSTTGAVSGAWADNVKWLSATLGLAEPPSLKTPPHVKKTHSMENRQASAEDAENLKADKYTLKDAISNLFDKKSSVEAGDDAIVIAGKKPPLTLEKFKENLKAIHDALDKVVEDRRKQMEDELKRLKIDPKSQRGQNMLKDLNVEIEALRDEAKSKVSKEIGTQLKDEVDKIEKFHKDLQTAIDQQYEMVQGQVTALGRRKYTESGAGVPDYVLQTYQRQSAIAKETQDKDTLANKAAELEKLSDAYKRFYEYASETAKTKLLDDLDVKNISELHDKIDTLTKDIAKLRSSFQDGLIPASFDTRLRMAVENYKQVHHLQASWTDMISGDLTNALSAGQNAFDQFFQGILSGNQTIGMSFGNLARSVIGYLDQMLAKMLATKMMEMVLGMFGQTFASAGGLNFNTTLGGDMGSFSASSLGSGTFDPSAMTDFSHLPAFRLNGGMIHALTGRYITDGESHRDSVPAMIAKGEYVVRKKAVDSVGVGFMEHLNKNGASALGAMSPHVVVPPPSNQHMNVYVVQEQRPPQMGPNDVLVTIANDIYHNGQTKQLIKSVMQGG